MTLMIRRVATALTTPLFAAAREPFARVTRWTEHRRLPPPPPAGEIELDFVDLLDDA